MKPKDAEEKDILDSYDRGEWIPVKNLSAEKKRFKELVSAALRKDKQSLQNNLYFKT